MSLFSKTKIVIWPKHKTTEIYFNRKENNFFSLDINLWDSKQPKDLDSLVFFLNQNKISCCSVLIPDDIAVTKSFVYDTKINSIDKKEVISLAKGMVNFNIDSESIDYSLLQQDDKTIINAIIYDKEKFDNLKNNLSLVNLQVDSYKPVSASISEIFSTIYLNEFFLIYPLNDHDYTLLLSKNNQIYLTANFKGSILDIQKVINYAQLYFSNPVKKLYYPDGKEIEINCTTEMEKTAYNESQIAQNFHKPSNLPLPVINQISAIIKPMNNKKNLLPIIAVAIFSFAIVSFIVYFIINKNNQEIVGGDQPITTITPTSEPVITQEPTPIIAEIEKDIKIQVLNATDINGQAATLKAKLVALGFENVSVGNAAKNATVNTVQVKSATTSAYFESKLVTDFPATYTTDLKTTSTYDAVFTIGTDLSTGASASTVTPTKTATASPTLKVTTTPAVEE